MMPSPPSGPAVSPGTTSREPAGASSQIPASAGNASSERKENASWSERSSNVFALQAEGLGGHGIVSIKLSWRRRPDLDFGELEVHDVNAVGLAVRATNSNYHGNPFTAATSGMETCALLRSGLAPSQVAFGVGIVKADMGNRTRRHMRSLGLAEVGQFSEALQKSLSLATADLETNAAADGEVIAGARPTVIFDRIVGAGLESHVRIVGTVLRRFKPCEQSDILPILRLSDRPRSP